MNHSKKWSKKAISMALVAAMVGTSVMPTFAASTDPNASAKREATNAAISLSLIHIYRKNRLADASGWKPDHAHRCDAL